MDALNWVPAWDKKIAEILKPIEPVSAALLIATAMLCLYVAIKCDKHPALQLLFLVFLWSP